MEEGRPTISPVPAGQARADFVCLSAKCQQDGGASTYELPVAAKVCPVCGSKRLRRLWNKAPLVLKSGNREKNTIVDHAVADALQQEHTMRDARLNALKQEAPTMDGRIDRVRVIPMPTKQFASMLPLLNPGMQVQTGGSKPGIHTSESVAVVSGRTPVPGPGSQADRSAITKEGEIVTP